MPSDNIMKIIYFAHSVKDYDTKYELKDSMVRQLLSKS